MEYSAEFIKLLDNVIEDGELTYKEIRELGKWMNENKSSRKLWPAHLFYDLLKRVFADGKIEESEAREVAKLIQSVRRDWVRKNTAATSPFGEPPTTVTSNVVTTTKVTSQAVEPQVFSVEQAILPDISIKALVQSSSESCIEYLVDLAGPTCTCPDFLPRSKLPKGDLSRCCKHVFQVFAKVRPKDGWTGWLDAFLELGIRPHPKTKWAVVKLDKDSVLISSAPQEWANVFLKSGQENERFGYNVSNNRWSYGTSPQDSSRLIAEIRKLNATA